MDQEDFDLMPDAVEDEEELDPHNPDDSFALLKRNYNKLLTEMEEDASQAKHVDELAKLFEYLRTVHEQAGQLTEENVRIRQELQVAAGQLQQSTQLNVANARTIVELNADIADSHALIDSAHQREQASQEVIDNLRRQMDALRAEIELQKKMETGALQEDPEAGRNRACWERERVQLQAAVRKLNEQLGNAHAYQEDLEGRAANATAEIGVLHGQAEEAAADVERYKRSKCRLEHALSTQQADLEGKIAEARSLTGQLRHAEERLAHMEGLLQEQSQAAGRTRVECEATSSRLARLRIAHDTVVQRLRELQKDKVSTHRLLGLKQDEQERAQLEMKVVQTHRRRSEQKIAMLATENARQAEESEKQRKVIISLQKSIDVQQRQLEMRSKTAESSRREKDVLNRNLTRLRVANEQNVEATKIQALLSKKLEDEVEAQSLEERKQSKRIENLQKEHDRMSEKVHGKSRAIEEAAMDLEATQTQLSDVLRALARRDQQLHAQQRLTESLQADKNAVEKTLQSARGEGRTMQDKLKYRQLQIEQLKEEVSCKEHLIIRERTALRKLAKERDGMKLDLSHRRDEIRALRQELQDAKDEEKRLNGILTTSDKTITDQVKAIAKLTNEREMLTAQLAARNDEVSLLYEKAKLLEEALDRGGTQYQQRLDDIRLMKVEIRRLRQEKSLLTRTLENMSDLKREVLHLERELTQERVKNKALEDEMHNPMNVHRWRKLEGSDPEAFELLQKLNMLQKQMFKQSSALAEREQQLKDANDLHSNLRRLLAKQPGGDVQQRIDHLQRDLTSSTNQMKVLITELDMLEVHNKECNLHLTSANKELQETRRLLRIERKKRASDIETVRAMVGTASALRAPSTCQVVKYAGGGFRMAVPASSANPRGQ